MAPNPYVKAVAPDSAKPKKDKKVKSPSKVAFSETPSSSNKGKGKAADEALRNEILALGGDEEELKMLEDVESDDELDGNEGQKDVDVSFAALRGRLRGGDPSCRIFERPSAQFCFI